MLDDKLIGRFRNLVNSNLYYLLHKHRNQEGRNRWSIICSAMDWITVASQNYNDFQFVDAKKDINKYCIQVYNYISIIDIINEAVIQLHRVITESPRQPFKGDKRIFSDNDQKDDDELFKHIRAIFGAHPVNLNKDNERWYASWPTKSHFNDYDIQVYLYPLDSNKKDKTFGIYLRELRDFAESRYSYLKDLMRFIDEDYKMYVKRCQEKEILFTNDDLGNIKILQAEHLDRLPNDYIRFMLEDTIRYFGVELSDADNTAIHQRFINKLRIAVDYLKVSVQMLDYDEKDSFEIFDYDFPEGHFYAFSKYMEVLGGKYDPLSDMFFEEIQECLKSIVSLNSSMSCDEQELLIVAALNELMEQKTAV